MVLITARSESSEEVVAISSEYLRELSVAVLLPSPSLAVTVRKAMLLSDEGPSRMFGVAEGQSRPEKLWKICVICRG